MKLGLVLKLVLLSGVLTATLCCVQPNVKRVAQTIEWGLPPKLLAEKSEVMMCAMIGKEAPYLTEWLAYHRLIGVSRFLLFELNTDNATRAVLKSLSHAAEVVSVPETAWRPE